MKIGFIGLPKSGKTTLFNALTGAAAAVSAFSTVRQGPNLASVKVGDERVTRLSAIYKPRRVVYPTIDIVDFAGVSEGDAKSDAFSGDLMKQVRNVDALAVVLRGFDSDLLGPREPLTDLRKVEDELLVADMIVVERRLERIEAGYKKGQKGPAVRAEEAVLRRAAAHLDAGLPLRTLPLEPDEEAVIRGFQFLTRKQALVILNSHEALYKKDEPVLAEIGKRYGTVEFAGEFEMELAALDEDSARAFMDDLHITESARDRLTALAYAALGYISFFTVGEDEVRAWNVRRNASVLEAAATIHTDLAKGFIAAELFTYADLVSSGSERAVKDRGKFRLAGRDYSVQDGDILSIRFNV